MRIRQDAFEGLVAHALDDTPNECCGLLVGAGDLVHDVVRARNALASPTQFQIEPADHFAAIRKARDAGLEVLGAYHSHPNGPSHPSETDRARLTDPTMVQVIVSLAAGTCTVRAFRFEAGDFSELELVTAP